MDRAFEALPRRIFLDSCAIQTLRDYGAYIYEGESIPDSDRIHRVTNGIANVEALREIMIVSQRAGFQWIISQGSIEEGRGKRDPGHMQWLSEVAAHSTACLQGAGPTEASEALAARFVEPRFGYLGEKDKLLLTHAVILRCDAFLTVERRLPRNSAHIERELGIQILTPIEHWEMLRPWAALWC
jgi:hypothetical protein